MEAWDTFLNAAEKELGEVNVNKWLRTVKVVHFDAANIYLEASDTFQLQWFEEHVRDLAQKKLVNSNFTPIKVHINIPHAQENKKHKTPVKIEIKPSPILPLVKDVCDPSATLENFIRGSGNEMAVNVLSLLCSFSPTTKLGQFNPLFLYGPSGTGKSHLLMAAAALLQKGGLQACYVKAETFTENVVQAIRMGNMQTFRHAYRHVDVLLVDDIHIFAKKLATQEEFFHTFNALHMEGKQILLSAHCHPSLLQDIEPRLISRFEWGLTLSIAKLEDNDLSRMLQNRCTSLQFPLQEEVIHFLIHTFSYNVKSLHRALEALILRFPTTCREQSLDLKENEIAKLLEDLIEKEKKLQLSPQKIVQLVSEHFGIKNEDILGKAQSQEFSLPRQVSMFLCRQKIKMPFAQIGDFFQRDHSTVMSSVRNIQEKIDSKDNDLRVSLRILDKKIELDG